MVGEQGLLGLVEEENGMVLVVEDAEGPVRVVCPKALSEINKNAAAVIRLARMSTRSPKPILDGGEEKPHPDDSNRFADLGAE